MSDPDPHLAASANAATGDADHDATRADLRMEIVALREEVSKLNNHRFLQIYARFWRLIGFQLLRGMAFGLGSVVGATVLVSILAYLLSQVDYIPILADWAAKLELETTDARTDVQVEKALEEVEQSADPDSPPPDPTPELDTGGRPATGDAPVTPPATPDN
ncbi:DUF5665 domain-containing protein [Vannielia sp.]|uniref:DUF5665 domain-containing protein n=1 Tax=Vannielia sp. TaxID=2813045 RepID=UPI0026397EE6|nr:DUF5665 domain-containing protein [Vannielia sp.]MDF1871005.1 DUF5665 domain-containing protein [Vannielia sp.]